MPFRVPGRSLELRLKIDYTTKDTETDFSETYKKAAFDESVEIWQAGKGVDRIESIESCADVLEGFRKGLM